MVLTNCCDAGPHVLIPKCHPEAELVIWHEGDTLTLECFQCRRKCGTVDASALKVIEG